MAVVPQDAVDGGEAERQSFSRYCLQVEIVIVSNGAEGGELQQGEGDEEDGYEENGAGVLLQGYRNDGCLQQRQRNFPPGDSFGFRILMLRAILTQHFINPHLICTQPLAHSLPVPVTTALARSISSLKWWLIQLDSLKPVALKQHPGRAFWLVPSSSSRSPFPLR